MIFFCWKSWIVGIWYACNMYITIKNASSGFRIGLGWRSMDISWYIHIHLSTLSLERNTGKALFEHGGHVGWSGDPRMKTRMTSKMCWKVVLEIFSISSLTSAEGFRPPWNMPTTWLMQVHVDHHKFGKFWSESYNFRAWWRKSCAT